jgi:hypothetical protein
MSMQSIINMHCLSVCVQGTLGVLIVAGGVVLLAMGSDGSSRIVHKCALVGLVSWGMWFAWLAWHGQPDSPPALAMAAAVAYVVVCNGRQLRGILDGELWWPKHGKPSKVAQVAKGARHGG